MPNRILKDSICTSENLDILTAEQEVFWYRLLVQCDDYGRMDARPAVIRARCYPLRLASVSEDVVVSYLSALAAAHLIVLYESGGRPYLQVSTWHKHQQIRAKRSKYPDMISDDINGNHLKANVPVIQSNPIQSKHPAASSAAWEAFTKARGANLTSLDSEQVAELEELYGSDAVAQAVVYCNIHKKDAFLRINYLTAVLRGWQSEGSLGKHGNPPSSGNGSKPESEPASYHDNMITGMREVWQRIDGALVKISEKPIPEAL